MRYVAAALLAALGGGEPNAANIKKILRFIIYSLFVTEIIFVPLICSSVGVDADDEKVDLVVKELAGKNVEELLEEGKGKLGSMPAGGAAPAAAAPAAGGAAAPAAEAKKEESEEEEDDDMGFGLFD